MTAGCVKLHKIHQEETFKIKLEPQNKHSDAEVTIYNNNTRDKHSEVRQIETQYSSIISEIYNNNKKNPMRFFMILQ